MGTYVKRHSRPPASPPEYMPLVVPEVNPEALDGWARRRILPEPRRGIL